MPYRTTIFASGEYYHIYNRGVAYQPIFKNKRDYERFVLTLSFYCFWDVPLRLSKVLHLSREIRENVLVNLSKHDNKSVEVIAYCLMPNHFHLLVKQVKEGGISKYLRKSINSYAKYYNTKYKRVGSLFQDMFKAIRIESDEQFIHVSRYIHLNPLVSFLVRRKEFLEYPWSSLRSYVKKSEADFVSTKSLLAHFKNRTEYIQFVLDQEEHGKKLEEIKHLVFEEG